MQPYRPLGTLYAATALREAGFSVALFDTMLRDPEKEFADFLGTHQPKIVAIYEDDFNFLSKMCLTRMRDVAWHLVRIAKAHHIAVIAHGSDASDHPELFLNHGVDYVLRGEAEQSLVELCLALTAGTKAADLDGLVARDPGGHIRYSLRSHSRNPEWAGLPQVPEDLTDFSLYREAWRQAHGYFSVNMVSSRGCPYRCNWCAKPISGNKFRLRTASSVAEEMRRLKSAAGAEHIWFSDDVFALNRHWVQDFATEVVRKDAVLPFKIQSRADLMSEETVEALRAAGCAEVWMGVESGSQKILNAMDKGLLLADVEIARQRLRHAGIRACYFLQFGYPDEGWSDLQETIQFVRETRPDDIGISFSYPLPGTVFYERVQAQLGTKRNWADSDDLCIMFHAAYNNDFYRAVRNALHAEVDTWSSAKQFDALPAEVEELWKKVAALEPVSRNPDALEALDASAREGLGTNEFIPVHQLTGTTGV
jgi:anaerobic magnesium-protoporphyrin IX monomethyl ester cyclase